MRHIAAEKGDSILRRVLIASSLRKKKRQNKEKKTNRAGGKLYRLNSKVMLFLNSKRIFPVFSAPKWRVALQQSLRPKQFSFTYNWDLTPSRALFFFQGTLGPSSTAMGAEGRPCLEGATGLWRTWRDWFVARKYLYSHQCGYFYQCTLTYPFGDDVNCPVKSSTKYIPKDLKTPSRASSVLFNTIPCQKNPNFSTFPHFYLKSPSMFWGTSFYRQEVLS